MISTSHLINGKVAIPAALRHQLHLRNGEQLIWTVRGNELVITTRRAQLSKLQNLLPRYIPAAAPALEKTNTKNIRNITNSTELNSLFSYLDKLPTQSRSKEEIDNYVANERAAWE